MAATKKRVTHYKTLIAGGQDIKELIPPANKTFSLFAISSTAPGLNGANAVLIKWDGNIIEAAQSDKFSKVDSLIVEGDGVKKLEIDLDNTASLDGAFLGATLYYEEIG